MSARFGLRQATRDAHERVDAAFSGFDVSTLEGYGDFLVAQAGAFGPVEAALEAAGAGDLIPDWPARRRTGRLWADLAALGRPIPVGMDVAALEGEAAIWGAAYVLEGSRLGGALIRRGLPEGAPQQFLGDAADGAEIRPDSDIGTPKGNASLWRAFIEALDARLTTPDDLEAAEASANAVFDCFHMAALGRRV